MTLHTKRAGTRATPQAPQPGPADARERLELALECARMVTFDWSLATGRIVRSHNAREVLGLTPGVAEDGAAEFLAALHPDDRPVVEDALARVREGEPDYAARFRIVRPDGGGELLVESRGRVVREADGALAISGVTIDLTARRRSELAIATLNADLARRVQELETLLAVIPAGIGIALEPACLTIRVNPAFAEMLGIEGAANASLSAPPAERPPFRAFADGRELAPEELPMQRAAATSRPVHDRELELRRADGRVLRLLCAAAPLFDEEGRVRGAVGAFIDISARLRAEDELRATARAQALLAAIVESSDDAIIGHGLDGTITSWNRGAARVFGYDAAEVTGLPATVLLPPGRADEMARILSLVQRGGRVEHFETERLRRDGRLLPVSITVSPVRGPDGEIVGASQVARDITGRRRVEAELREAKETAEAANRAKDQFLAVLSHELRTPLTPVLAIVSALERQTGLEPSLRRDLAMIRRNVELEARLIDDLLDLTRIARGKLKLHRVPTDVRIALKDALQASWSHDPAKKKLALELELRAGRHVVLADGPRLTQVFWNLLNNAVKFTPAGGRVTIRSRSEGDTLRIEVEDTGIGIAPESMPYIFQAFEQGQPGGARDYGGIGMGLAISRAIVERHGGTLEARSPGRGEGSVFVLRLPILAGEEPAAVPSAEAPAATRARTLHVLLVEDHADTADAMALLLRQTGHRVTVARSVAEALAAAADAPADAPVELIISDLDLPDGSGHELMRTLTRDRGPLPGIALSGFGMDDDVRRSAEAGFARHLTKPVNVEQLEAVIAEIAG